MKGERKRGGTHLASKPAEPLVDARDLLPVRAAEREVPREKAVVDLRYLLERLRLEFGFRLRLGFCDLGEDAVRLVPSFPHIASQCELMPCMIRREEHTSGISRSAAATGATAAAPPRRYRE